MPETPSKPAVKVVVKEASEVTVEPSELIEATAEAPPSSNVVRAEPAQNQYSTEFYKASGIPYCKTCGEVFLTNENGSPQCAESRSNCPRMQ